MEHKGTEILQTEHLILRPFRMEDAEPMYRNWASDSEVTKFLTWPAHKDVSVTVATMSHWVPKYSDRSFYQWAITLNNHNDEPIGSISIVNEIDPVIGDAEIGYCIGKTWWHQGITSEALKAVIEFLFDEVGVNKVSARHDVNNPNSGKVMQKCGLHYEGTLRQSSKNNQGVCDICCYGVLASER